MAETEPTPAPPVEETPVTEETSDVKEVVEKAADVAEKKGFSLFSCCKSKEAVVEEAHEEPKAEEDKKEDEKPAEEPTED